ncbi:MAG: FliH/SctL family protein [Pseudomonadota bacterium]
MPVHPSPEQEKTVELQRGLEVLQRKLAQIVQSIDGELRAAKGQITSQAAGAIAASATTLLPSLLDEGFAQELSSATLQIATAVEPDQIALRVHPDDHDPIVDALHSLAPPSPVTIEKDGGLRPGSVRLSWSNGGAEMNREALLNNARDLLEARLASIVSGRNQDDHRIQY